MHLTLEHRQKISKSHKGITPTTETRRKLVEAARKRWLNPETRQKIMNSLTGKTRKMLSAEQRQEISKRMKGRKLSDEHRSHMREAIRRLMALNPDKFIRSKSRPVSSETRVKISNAVKAYLQDPENRKRWSEAQKGPRNSSWNGGTSFLPYSPAFTKQFREAIKTRDSQTCQVCESSETGHHVHHIDYDKQNCLLSNLITLCKSCHQKTNFKRGYWQSLFQEVQHGEPGLDT